MPDSTRTDNKQKIDKLFDSCFNHHDLAVLDELVSPDYVGPQGDKGPAAFRAVVGGLHTAFPDIHYTIDEVVGEEDRVAIRWHWAGTHRGTFRGIPATGKAVSTTGAGDLSTQRGQDRVCRPRDRSARIFAAIGSYLEDAVPSSPPSARGGTRSSSSSPGSAAP